MEIRLHKPSCPDCKSNNITIYLKHSFIDCRDCGKSHSINIIFEEAPLFCNCEVCKKING